jgi:hypothetical protein
MTHVDPVKLRFELLRARAAVERAEMRMNMRALDRSTRPLRNLIGGVFGSAQRLEGRRPGAASWIANAVGFVRERPWLVSAAMAVLARRRLRRWVMLGGVALAGVWLARTLRAHYAEQELLLEDDY